MSRAERVDLLMIRHDQGYLLWNPEDRLDADEMSKEGFEGGDRLANGEDKPLPAFSSLEQVADAIARRELERRGAA
jgi:hypothetical protein